jgi:hypothetical protein
VRQWIADCRSIPDLLEFLVYNSQERHLDDLAYQQLQLLMAAEMQAINEQLTKETHDHIRSLRPPPVLRDPRTYMGAMAGFLAGLFSGLLVSWITNAIMHRR